MTLSIADALNAIYAQEADKDSLVDVWRPRPSNLGGCLREAAWRLAGGPYEVVTRSPESMRVLELGHQRGEALEQRALAAWPNDAEVQVPLKIPWPGGFMEGTCDVWIPSLRCIVDFKTAGAFKMGLLVGEEEDEDEGYALQLNAYRHGILQSVRDLFDDLADIRTVLLYESKDGDARKGIVGGQFYEQEIPYSQELETKYQMRLRALYEITKTHAEGTLDPLAVPGMPPDAKGRPHWRCRMKNDKPLYCSIGPIQGKCQ